MERMFWISMEYATFGIISRDDIIVDAPDIARWMISKRLTDIIKPWLLKRRAKVIEIALQHPS